MGKTSAIKIYNELRKAGLTDRCEIEDNTFTSFKLNTKITLSQIEAELNGTPSFNNYQLLKYTLATIITQHKRDYQVQFLCYQLIGKYAKAEGVNEWHKHFELSMYYHLKWKLQDEYCMVMSNRGCSKCQSLDSKYFTASDALYDLPLLVSNCDLESNCCTVVSLSAKQYYKRA